MNEIISAINRSKFLFLVPVVLLIAAACNSQKPISQTNNQPQQNQQTSQAINETANWKTYTSSQYGFEFKYPKEWSLEDLIQNPVRDGKTYKLSIMMNPGGNLGSVSYCEANLNSDARCQMLKIDGGKSSAIIDWGGSEGNTTDIIISSHNGGNVGISITEYTSADKPLINKILSIFKFTNIAPTSRNKPCPSIAPANGAGCLTSAESLEKQYPGCNYKNLCQ